MITLLSGMKGLLARMFAPTKKQPIRRQKSSCRPLLELLEDRVVPTSSVTSAFSTLTGALTITADFESDPNLFADNNNSLLIDGTGGTVTIVDLGGTPVNGAGDTFTGVNSIKFNMGVGDDIVTVTALTLTGTLTFNGNDGNDALNIDGSGGDNTIRAITVLNGDGNDTFTTTNGTNQITGSLTINNGTGDSTTTINEAGGDTTISGAFSITNTAGLDTFSAGGASFTVLGGLSIKNGSGGSSTNITSTTFDVGGIFSVTNTGGVDQFAIAAGTTANLHTTSISNGVGSNTVASSTNMDGDAISITGALTVINGDGAATFDLSGIDFTVSSTTTIRYGSGQTQTFLGAANSATFGSLIFSALGGDDLVQFDLGAGSFKAVTLTLGDGDNEVDFLAGTSQTMTSLAINSLEGNDLVTVDSDSFTVTGAVSINLGNGVNNTLLNPVSNSAIGTTLTVRGLDGVDTVDLHRLNVTGATLVDVGSGADLVSIYDSAFTGTFTCNTGAGGDTIDIESDAANSDNGTPTVFKGLATFNTGSGNDTVNVGIDFDVDDDEAQFSKTVTFNGGLGFDTITIFDNRSNLFPVGGPKISLFEVIV